MPAQKLSSSSSNNNNNNNPRTDSSSHIRSPSFAVLVQALYNHQFTCLAVPSCEWPVDGYVAPLDVFHNWGTLKIFIYIVRLVIFL